MNNEEEEYKNKEMQLAMEHSDDESIINPQDLDLIMDEVLLHASGKLSVLPDECGQEERKLWVSLKKMTIKDFEKFYAIASEDTPKLPVDNVKFCSFKMNTIYQCYGMIKDDETSTGGTDEIPHGWVRKLLPNGEIYEQTFCNGRDHGLIRNVYRGAVDFSVYDQGDCIATLTISKDRKETQRWDPRKILENYTKSSIWKN